MDGIALFANTSACRAFACAYMLNATCDVSYDECM